MKTAKKVSKMEVATVMSQKSDIINTSLIPFNSSELLVWTVRLLLCCSSFIRFTERTETKNREYEITMYQYIYNINDRDKYRHPYRDILMYPYRLLKIPTVYRCSYSSIQIPNKLPTITQLYYIRRACSVATSGKT